MELMKRWYRRFDLNISAEEVKAVIAAAKEPEQYTNLSLGGPYTPEDAGDLIGKKLVFRAEERTFSFDFKNLNEVAFAENEGEEKICFVNVKTLDHEVFFVNFLVPGYACARQITLIPDMITGYATIVDAHFGTENSAIDVSREFIFGRLDGDFKDGEPHAFTNELVGTAIEWDYGPQVRMPIRHMYTSNLYYTYGAASPFGAWMATNPANYAKIRDDLFLFSFVEERQAGLQGLFLIDLKRMHDVGSFFGVARDHMTSACVGAKGELKDITMIF